MTRDAAPHQRRRRRGARLCVESLARRFGRIILAGGLDPDNVAEAIETARPYAVDVSSGVEVVPGKKDIDKLEELVARVRETDARLLRSEESA